MTKRQLLQFCSASQHIIDVISHFEFGLCKLYVTTVTINCSCHFLQSLVGNSLNCCVLLTLVVGSSKVLLRFVDHHSELTLFSLQLSFQELGLGPSVPVHAVLHDWIRHTDGKLSFLGFVKLLHGMSSRTLAKAH